MALIKSIAPRAQLPKFDTAPELADFAMSTLLDAIDTSQRMHRIHTRGKPSGCSRVGARDPATHLATHAVSALYERAFNQPSAWISVER
jgi:hypothetical protein